MYGSTYTPGGTPDRTPSPGAYAGDFVLPRQMAHSRPPPPRPAVPPFDLNTAPREEQPWCNVHVFRSDYMNCWKCAHVRDWSRRELAEGN
eukprot:15088084-Heterocapsa_arctica.AAC.1